ncbi:hypothetical protein [Bradyrhizobium sp. BWC-3-1]|uniref:hypothetical protein n=1 Tax=Bradyrhizobium sp. BWC-3-1 TaxID=3080012 RepID=UPI00293E35C3|nr:hypothetical protein [Bradyrhizobium sp. BWC-3-1]WOH59463.1 hypothetical protein RX329_04880 [Bradyrhizobium sp. BWC-3-1]
MKDGTIHFDRDSGNWWAMVRGRWVLQGNLHDVARNAARWDSDVIVNIATARCWAAKPRS